MTEMSLSLSLIGQEVKNNIAKNLFAQGHETDNTHYTCHLFLGGLYCRYEGGRAPRLDVPAQALFYMLMQFLGDTQTHRNNGKHENMMVPEPVNCYVVSENVPYGGT